ncbi:MULTISPECIES: GNAT family N-acetyltransferase [Halococcus]|uniref:GCN5-like N-acetyltransferase n=1 Tax=Halococcus salifodinae DSM 8989 TaxID=1227456 RepID=M0MXM2_9EURY|nr:MULTISPECIES: GNAT family N-acetyltransferase [Halococcus]EMA50048.1 GCN5-like N-acetyltransferase [Halococcus salifodinae DSM 8989]
MSRPYPDEPAGPFERPPETFTDAHGREIEISVYDDEEFTVLAEMYVAFDPADRAQGIPPANEEAIEEWLDTILESGYDVVAYHGDTCVGHATLVADGDACHELAIFVLDTHQAAGIGSRLLKALLGHAGREGAERVWLTVERWNQAAIALYRKVGFETCDSESFEIEMAIRL